MHEVCCTYEGFHYYFVFVRIFVRKELLLLGTRRKAQQQSLFDFGSLVREKGKLSTKIGNFRITILTFD